MSILRIFRGYKIWRGRLDFYVILLILNTEDKFTENAMYLFYNVNYSEGKRGETRLQCFMSEMWLHCIKYVMTAENYASNYYKQILRHKIDIYLRQLFLCCKFSTRLCSKRKYFYYLLVLYFCIYNKGKLQYRYSKLSAP